MANRDPSPERPITAEWNNSTINIYDIPGIVEDAATARTAIYDRSGFPHPIDRIQVEAEVVIPEGDDALALTSTIDLDKTEPWNRDWLHDRFNNSLTPRNPHAQNYQKRGPLRIKPVIFSDTFLISDEKTGSKFVLWVQASGKIVITNNIKLAQEGGQALEMRPPAMSSIQPEDQLKSLMQATALLADFINAFSVRDHYSDKARGLPLGYEYIVGKERRRKTKKMAQGLGRTALTPPQDKPSQAADPESAAWEETNGIEKFQPGETVALSDIGGLAEIKQTLYDVATSFKHPEIMRKWGAARPQGVLLYGEPGTGKTMLAKALANEMEAELWAVSSTDIYEKWLGQSGHHIKDIFKRARQAKGPLVLFFDEFDSIVSVNEDAASGANSERNAVAGIFKQEMNTLAQDNPNVLVVAATNHRDRIHPSLIRSGRFDHKIYVPMPNHEARQEIAVNIIAKSMVGNAGGF